MTALKFSKTVRLSISRGSALRIACRMDSRNELSPGPSMRARSPGLVHIWPAYRLTAATYPSASSSPLRSRAWGRMKTGFKLPISA